MGNTESNPDDKPPEPEPRTCSHGHTSAHSYTITETRYCPGGSTSTEVTSYDSLTGAPVYATVQNRCSHGCIGSHSYEEQVEVWCSGP